MSSVWKYFRKLPNDPNFAKCLYTDSDGKECSKIISCKGGSTSGLIRHLPSHNIQLSSSSSSSNPTAVQTTINFPKQHRKVTLGEILAEVAAVDGISLNAIVNSKYVKFYVSNHGYNMPKSTTTVKKEILKFYEIAVEEYKSIFANLLKSNKKFSITTDEWSNMLTLQRFINVTVHTGEDYFKLGLKVFLF